MKINTLLTKCPRRRGSAIEKSDTQATQRKNQFYFVCNKTRITPPSGESSPNGENKNVPHPSDHSDSYVRLWWLSHGTWAGLLRRRRHQPPSHHRPHPALAQSHLATDHSFFALMRRCAKNGWTSQPSPRRLIVSKKTHPATNPALPG